MQNAERRKRLLAELGKKVLFFDGGMGTMLQDSGLQAGELPETWNLKHPEKMQEIHRAYLEAGADLILTNTFGANRFKYGEDLAKIVQAGVTNAQKARTQSGREAFVALDIGPTGKLLKPLGTLDFEEAVRTFGEVVRIGEEAGADLILIETMSDTYEMKAAVLAAKENTKLPVFATAIFDESGKMLTGSSPAGLVAMLEGLGVDALGINCGLGPKQMKEVCRQILQEASVPVIVNPNAGLPRTENGQTVYDVGPEEFAADMQDFVKMGAWIVGGCCGTTPAHIRKLTEKCRNLKPAPVTRKERTLVTSYAKTVELGGAPVLIGERINPTGKKLFKQALRDHNMGYILEEAVRQEESGAHILDVNVGLPEIDEVQMMQETVYELQSILPLPLQIDTTSPAAMELALRRYNGKAMVNSVNGKQEVMEQIFPLVRKYGGVVVGLTIDEDGIPDTADGRVAIAQKIYRTAQTYGIQKKDIVIDALTMTMSTNDRSAAITLEAVRRIHAMGGKTVLGVSNISFGLPERKLLNAAFFTMALENGLSAGIINPNVPEMRTAYDTFCVLHGYDPQCRKYIEAYANRPQMQQVPAAQQESGRSPASQQGAAAVQDHASQQESGSGKTVTPLMDAVVRGLKEQAFQETCHSLQQREPMAVINEELVPALDIVGKGFEEKTMFLPQLLMSAEAAKSGFDAIKEHLQKTGKKQEEKATVVIATVKGDIHDIGKNIVRVLLENYGYRVVDLGKDVPPERVVEAVVQEHAPVAGLSALMTTTVVNMEETIRQLRKEAPWCRIMVGGAVLTQEYADRIGADFYGKDAMQSVYYVEHLYQGMKKK